MTSGLMDGCGGLGKALGRRGQLDGLADWLACWLTGGQRMATGDAAGLTGRGVMVMAGERRLLEAGWR
jgi:hypothetical protein